MFIKNTPHKGVPMNTVIQLNVHNCPGYPGGKWSLLTQVKEATCVYHMSSVWWSWNHSYLMDRSVLETSAVGPLPFTYMVVTWGWPLTFSHHHFILFKSTKYIDFCSGSHNPYHPFFGWPLDNCTLGIKLEEYCFSRLLENILHLSTSLRYAQGTITGS